MGSHAPRLLVCAAIAIAACVTGTIALDPHLTSIESWTDLAYAALIALQAGRRLLTDTSSARLTRFGYLIGLGCASTTAVTAYLLGLDADVAHRRWAPPILIAGELIGLVALYYASDGGRGELIATAPPPVRGAARPTRPPSSSDSGAEPMPSPLRGKLSYATATAEITIAGVDARREDGVARLVLWRDVVGVVARRLPAAMPYEGAPFVDLVSTATATLRILPWTRLSGERLDGIGERRLRALVQLVVARCPEVQLDPATRRFLAGPEQPAQLPDEATLAAHDGRLA
ncbi:MAG TPA: hypothetical protein VLX92_21410 [Kofleriaceae bacterium]|nr:hypothetical protein [Kofleriaceae bacterium]